MSRLFLKIFYISLVLTILFPKYSIQGPLRHFAPLAYYVRWYLEYDSTNDYHYYSSKGFTNLLDATTYYDALCAESKIILRYENEVVFDNNKYYYKGNSHQFIPAPTETRCNCGGDFIEWQETKNSDGSQDYGVKYNPADATLYATKKAAGLVSKQILASTGVRKLYSKKLDTEYDLYIYTPS